jgi:hypothetical protein
MLKLLKEMNHKLALIAAKQDEILSELRQLRCNSALISRRSSRL